MYRAAMLACTPIVRWWGRARVEGVEALPAEGPALIVGNHDSYWDPISVGVAALGRRQIHALAKKELWGVPALGPILNGMGQIPIDRGAGDLHAMDRAIEALRNGAVIGVFPEGTRSKGRELRARSGIARLAAAVPEAVIVGVSITGTVQIPQVPTRPRVSLRFFRPAGGGLQDGEQPSAFAARLLAECRAGAPITPHGWRRSKKPTPA